MRTGRPAPLALRLIGLLVLLALVLGGVLLWSAPAEARDAVRILVSNVGQGSDDDAETSGNDHAQLFHTAGATHGYTLTSVIVVSADTAGDDFDVDVCEADTTANQFPTSTCTALTRPGSEPEDFAAGSLEFTHDGLVLSANTNYVVVIKQVGSGSVTLDSTTAAGEDSTGLTGWSIKDKYYWNNGGFWQLSGSSNEAIQITVNGHERAANQDATGRPVIYPSAEGAGLLVADVYGIDDPDGSTFANVTGDEGVGVGFFDFSYQWIRVDGGTETNIGVDSPTYQRVDADTGKLIKVEVSFKDGHGYSETVTSLPFGPIAEPADPLLSPSTLVSNTGQTASATANITQQYAMGFRLGDQGQGYPLSIRKTASDAEDAGGEPGATLGDNALERARASTGRWRSAQTALRGSVLRLAVKGSRRASGSLASNFAPEDGSTGDQEITSDGDSELPVATSSAPFRSITRPHLLFRPTRPTSTPQTRTMRRAPGFSARPIQPHSKARWVRGRRLEAQPRREGAANISSCWRGSTSISTPIQETITAWQLPNRMTGTCRGRRA